MIRGGHSAVPGVGKRGGALIVSGETVLGSSHYDVSPGLGASGKKGANPFLASIFNDRNTQVNKSTASGGMSLRRSKDLREELLNQRILTSLKLESVNIKAPLIWRQKEEAYLRQRDPKNQTAYQFPSVKPV